MTSPTGSCWQALAVQREAVFKADFLGKFQKLSRPFGRLQLEYAPDPGSYTEAALAVQSRDLAVSSTDGARGQAIATPYVGLYRGPVHSLCNVRREDFAQDTELLFQNGPAFTATVKDYQTYHGRSFDLSLSRGVFRDFHFQYARAKDKYGRPVVCIDTDSIRDGNRDKYNFADLRQATIVDENPGFVAYLMQLVAPSAFATPADASFKYIYSNLQSKNIWFSHDKQTPAVRFTLGDTSGLQVISLANLEARDESRAPEPTKYFLVDWQ